MARRLLAAAAVVALLALLAALAVAQDEPLLRGLEVLSVAGDARYRLYVVPRGNDALGLDWGQGATMVSRSRRRFQCVFPDADQLDAVAALLHPRADVDAVLHPLLGKCATKPNGYWTFEYCHGVHMAQVHSDDKGVHRILLGRFDSARSSLNGSLTEYFHYLANGDACGDVKRSAIVRFECGDLPEMIVHDVDEPEECEYDVVVRTPLVCDLVDHFEANAAAAAASRKRASKPAPIGSAVPAPLPAPPTGAALPLPASHMPMHTLRPLLTGPCLHFNAPWWTYEFCPAAATVRQLHRESNGDVSNQYSLGNKLEVAGVEHVEGDERFIMQRYSNGTACGLADRNRTTTVLFQCPRDVTMPLGAHIASVKEVATCHYEVLVQVPALCSLRQFRRPTVPIHSILCREAPDSAPPPPPPPEPLGARVDAESRDAVDAAHAHDDL